MSHTLPAAHHNPAFVAPQPGLVSSDLIFRAALTPQCHASILAQTHGALVAAWFGGSHEYHPDVGIWTARQERGQWSPPVQVAEGMTDEGARCPCWNPVLFQPATGPLLLFYKVGPSPSERWGLCMASGDGGQT